MSLRDGFPCWVDLGVHDVDAALAFYAEAMGWRAGERSGPEFGGYAMWFCGDVPTAGVGPARGGTPACWTTYLATSDIDRTLALVEPAGGGVTTPVMVIGPLGRMAVVRDPVGATFGLWEAHDFAGFPPGGEPGFLDWCVVETADVDASRTFLQALFGFEVQVPDPDPGSIGYLQLGNDGIPAIGVRPIAGDTSAWMAYFSVDDVDAVAGRVLTAGGRLLRESTTGAVGTMATLADPEGASFSVISS
ncbi:MAG: VOC family protein [Candidatus Nanopelagicales bacterium]